MSKRTLSLWVTIVAGCGLAADRSSGETWYTPRFGSPLVNGDQLVFSEASISPHRIIAVLKHDGTRVWELKDTNSVLRPWLALDGELLATKGSEIISVTTNGHFRTLANTQYGRPGLSPYGSNQILALGERDGLYRLSLHDAKDGRVRWQATNIFGTLAVGDNVLLCNAIKSAQDEQDRVWFSPDGLIALSALSGEELWRLPASALSIPSAIAIGRCFVIGLQDRVLVVDQTWGTAIKQHDMPETSIELRAQAEKVVARARKDGEYLSAPAYFSFTIPDLNRSPSTEDDWNRAGASLLGDLEVFQTRDGTSARKADTGEELWNARAHGWIGIHEGWIYFDVQETNQTHVSIHGIEVGTGSRRVIYRELLPEEVRMYGDKLGELLKARYEREAREIEERQKEHLKRREEESRQTRDQDR